MNAASGDRINALDLIRGIAVLGILAVNITGFAGPLAATITPNWNGPTSFADQAAFAGMMVLFEGKMRALFTLLFGASMLLFVERADAAGRSGESLQMRRLGWLALIGYLHFALLWWGDILFTYALAGLTALSLRAMPVKTMVPAALLLFTAWNGWGMANSVPPILAEARVVAGMAPPAEANRVQAEAAKDQAENRASLARTQAGFLPQVQYKQVRKGGFPLVEAFYSMGETLPLMLLGMALYLTGFFTGAWPRARLVTMAWGGIGGGGVVTVLLTALAWQRQFPPRLMEGLLGYWLAVPHLAMAMGYAAALMLAAPRLLNWRLGQRIQAAGRMALTNYLGTTVLMTGLFYGWGLGLGGKVPDRWLGLFVLLGWVAMLAASKPWLARFRQGPLEWAWRSLTEWRRLPLR